MPHVGCDHNFRAIQPCKAVEWGVAAGWGLGSCERLAGVVLSFPVSVVLKGFCVLANLISGVVNKKNIRHEIIFVFCVSFIQMPVTIIHTFLYDTIIGAVIKSFQAYVKLTKTLLLQMNRK